MHIGHKIEEVVRSKGIGVSWLASQICCSRSNVYKIFSNPKIDIEMLRRLGEVLNYDFFSDLSHSSNPSNPS